MYAGRKQGAGGRGKFAKRAGREEAWVQAVRLLSRTACVLAVQRRAQFGMVLGRERQCSVRFFTADDFPASFSLRNNGFPSLLFFRFPSVMIPLSVGFFLFFDTDRFNIRLPFAWVKISPLTEFVNGLRNPSPTPYPFIRSPDRKPSESAERQNSAR